jgi:hypothetical protein
MPLFLELEKQNNTMKNRNPIAKKLRTSQFKKRIVKNKTKYNRKNKDYITIEDNK